MEQCPCYADTLALATREVRAFLAACVVEAMRCHEVLEPRLFYGRGESFCVCISEHRDVVLQAGIEEKGLLAHERLGPIEGIEADVVELGSIECDLPLIIPACTHEKGEEGGFART